MALKLSKNIGLTDIVTDVNPITTQHINTGEAKEVKVWLFNDAATFRYEGIVLSAVDTSGSDESSWIKFAADSGGVAGTYNSTLNMANISDSAVAKPFWVKVTSANVTGAQNKTDLAVRIAFNEFVV